MSSENRSLQHTSHNLFFLNLFSMADYSLLSVLTWSASNQERTKNFHDDVQFITTDK